MQADDTCSSYNNTSTW